MTWLEYVLVNISHLTNNMMVVVTYMVLTQTVRGKGVTAWTVIINLTDMRLIPSIWYV